MKQDKEYKPGEPLKEGVMKGNIRKISSKVLRADPPKPIKKPGK